ncbi:unnamed protein product, partial [Gulo gulo]
GGILLVLGLKCGLRADSSEKQSPERRVPRCSPPSYSPVPPLVLLLREASKVIRSAVALATAI